MKNQWALWLFVIAIVAVVLFAFNYTGNKDTVPLSEIFPEDNAKIEYEFVDKNAASVESETASTDSAEQPTTAAAPAAPAAAPASTAAAPAASKPVQSASASSSPAPIAEKPNFSKVSFTIQVASHKSKQQAEIALKGIQAAGHPAYMEEVNLGAKGTWYRIYVGNFQTKEQASSYLANVKPTYKDSFIISPKSR